MANKLTCIRVLLPALIENDAQKAMTETSFKSIISLNHCVKVQVDNKRYELRVAGVWNAFFDEWRGKEYDYLMIMANDVQLDIQAIDFMVTALEANPDAGVSTCHVTRDIEEFETNYGQHDFDGTLTESYHKMDPACFMLRKGVIETVGRIDEQFPCEFVERDYWKRCLLAGFKWIEPAQTLCYHPPYSATIGNDDERLKKALKRYVDKWGGDANQERYNYPYNDMNLDYTFTGKYER